jgi:hypothetical protein
VAGLVELADYLDPLGSGVEVLDTGIEGPRSL